MRRGRVPIYLGGPSREIERVRRWARTLDATGGFVPTSRWFDDAESWSGRDAELDDAEQAHRARQNFDGLRRAGVVWILWPEDAASSSALCELGYALAQGWHVGPTLIG